MNDQLIGTRPLSPSEKRERGLAYYYNEDSTCIERQLGLNLIFSAYRQNDPEATFTVGCLLLRGIYMPASGMSDTEAALNLFTRAASLGYAPARDFLNRYCAENYQEKFGTPEAEAPDYDCLVDFDGKPIKFARMGKRSPVKAVLSRENGRNILTLDVKVSFLYMEELPNAWLFEQAVQRGLLEWEGDYIVFGGQRLTVRVNISKGNGFFRSVCVAPLSGELRAGLRQVGNKVAVKKYRERLTSIIDLRRSFAATGLGWRINSLKMIWVQSPNDRFDDYEEIRHVAKHEFGHTLGLGDLYESRTDSLVGVEVGSFPELDCYAVGKKLYNLVMCDHRGVISNNDIEMVILAFRENKMQLFQPFRLRKKSSSALGRGN